MTAGLAHIDEEVDMLAEDEKAERQSRLKNRWVGAGKSKGAELCIESVVTDLVAHFEERNQAQNGETMVVVMSCEICLHLYNEIITQRPEWHNEAPLKYDRKVRTTGKSPRFRAHKVIREFFVRTIRA